MHTTTTRSTTLRELVKIEDINCIKNLNVQNAVSNCEEALRNGSAEINLIVFNQKNNLQLNYMLEIPRGFNVKSIRTLFCFRNRNVKEYFIVRI